MLVAKLTWGTFIERGMREPHMIKVFGETGAPVADALS
jgi:hypothetical protein